ncbi:MAG: prepilin-type N-terminal cleavage/methylation domain-containing protein [Candidatus Omnitrophota bacterium]
MLHGLKNKEIETFSCLPDSLSKKKAAVTLVEMMVGVFILSVLIAGALASMKVGEFFLPLSSTKVDLQAKARGIIDWIKKDIRQAANWSIANNSPSSSYIKFQQVTGLDTGTGLYLLTADFTEYIYDSVTGKITRNTVDAGGNAVKNWEAGNITQPPFYTRDSSGNEVDLNKDDLNNCQKIIIRINAQKQVRGALSIPYALMTEVKIRNE